MRLPFGFTGDSLQLREHISRQLQRGGLEIFTKMVDGRSAGDEENVARTRFRLKAHHSLEVACFAPS
jgi:uncharacterized protein YicC (UPF0701 family)